MTQVQLILQVGIMFMQKWSWKCICSKYQKVCLTIYANDDGLEENGVIVENKAIGDLLEFIADMLMTE